MPIRFDCVCGTSFLVPDAHVGKSGRCGGCGAQIVVPTLAEVDPLAPGSVIGASWLPLPPICPHCGLLIEPAPKRSRKCPYCRNSIIRKHDRLFASEEAVAKFEQLRDTREAVFNIDIFHASCGNLICPAPVWSLESRWPICRFCKGGPAYFGKPGEILFNNSELTLWQAIATLEDSCGVCIQNHTRIGAWWPFPSHLGCKCINHKIGPGEYSIPFANHQTILDLLNESQKHKSVGHLNWMLLEAGLVNWSEIVTRSGVCEFHAVVGRKRLTVKQMLQAGIPESDAVAAWNLVNSPERIAERSRIRELAARLRQLGLSDKDISNAVAGRLTARLFGDDINPSSSESMPPRIGEQEH